LFLVGALFRVDALFLVGALFCVGALFLVGCFVLGEMLCFAVAFPWNRLDGLAAA
jgi:hypothetical protein